MNGHNHLRMLHQTVLLVGAIVLIAGHGVILYYVSSHIAVSAAIAFGVIVLLMLTHLGVLSGLYRVLRRRPRRK
jgi:membrane protein YdbS with pleckstrin-like domain